MNNQIVIDSKGNFYNEKDLLNIATNFILKSKSNKLTICAKQPRIQTVSIIRHLSELGTNILFTQYTQDHPYVLSASDFLKHNLNICESNSQLIFLTSGSTGLPKLVVHKYENLVKAGNKILSRYPNILNSRFHHLFPANYMAGVLNCTIVPFLSKGTILLDDEFNFSSTFTTLDTAEKYKSEIAWLSPSMLKALSISAKKKKTNFSAWKMVLTATGPITTSIRDEAAYRLGCEVKNTYGTTEALFITGEIKMNAEVTCGSTFSKVELRTGNKSAKYPIGHGEIFCSTDTYASHIFQATKKDNVIKFKEISHSEQSFIPTGDYGYLQDNNLIVNGRVDDMVVLGGLNISLSGVENCARDYPGVLEVCAIAPYGGNISDLVVMYEDNENLVDENKLKLYIVQTLTEELSSIKVRRAKLPRTASGKLDRELIRSEYLDS